MLGVLTGEAESLDTYKVLQAKPCMPTYVNHLGANGFQAEVFPAQISFLSPCNQRKTTEPAPAPELEAKGARTKLVGHQDMASARARAYNGGLEAEPQVRSRGIAPGQCSGGLRPQKLKAFFAF